MNKITVKRLIQLLDEREVKSEEDYIALVHEIKDWKERSKAETKTSQPKEKKTSEKGLNLSEEYINDVCDSAQEIVQGELDKINDELTSLTSPVNKFQFVNEKMNQAQYLHGEINGINLIRESLLHDYALKSSHNK